MQKAVSHIASNLLTSGRTSGSLYTTDKVYRDVSLSASDVLVQVSVKMILLLHSLEPMLVHIEV